MADAQVDGCSASASQSTAEICLNLNPNFDGDGKDEKKKKVVVIMGATGAGKSKLSIDLASYFSGVEVVNADSMQVYCGLDVLTNKVPLPERKDIPHHLLGTVDASMEFTSKHFRDFAIPIIDDILSRDSLPVIVGGTNYYIQALLSPFLFDDMHETLSEFSDTSTPGERDLGDVEPDGGYDCLSEIDPVAANRIHPNDHRKIRRYLSLYSSTGMLPSKLFQGGTSQRWGRDGNFRYQCCFLWIDASLEVLDKYINERVDVMMHSGMLDEVADIYNSTANAVYTKGLLQAIGVREFDEFFKKYGENIFENHNNINSSWDVVMRSGDEEIKDLLKECVDKFKNNTRRLVRRQRRRLAHLREDFGWNLHHINATEAFLCREEEVWKRCVVEPSVAVISTFLSKDGAIRIGCTPCTEKSHNGVSRDLWTQFMCEACGNRVLRGTHEWEQHKQGNNGRDGGRESSGPDEVHNIRRAVRDEARAGKPLQGDAVTILTEEAGTADPKLKPYEVSM
ncbi:tRNA dimethylallyltransferase 2 isoform X1 [Carex littledalei]|uniref:tRNA dimethylallyltransferase 2 isoform X1 n=1 Tax=Carex littledalei TaxID=544730 RepID=A0A833RMS0_9POAL|nr:tRNA dimethylallyltransferase 2 isoform X1 [Carex littledalei]